MLLKTTDVEVPADATRVNAGDFNGWKKRLHQVLETETNLQKVYYDAVGKVARTFPVIALMLTMGRIDN